MDRTIKLTHEQVATIKEALGIAEKTYSDIFKSICELNQVRNNENAVDNKTIGLNYHDKSWMFAELNIDLQKGTLDV